ncbi:twin-arginine translocase subunit TatC [Gracilimonas sediminicola]|uniref:Sec-independent protein translocase protein TatC n=1 Tax=Gracilimonas sediminicola TaxID=2952158 RepID=A0A9X2L7F8_9BACT|nr:twin-arginine translocase subunit TatC [Gracilimonas sediminicola]MCP9292923.1 twin-arginine translocase subunit TatC [Gracilimonas sediminicola]
MEERQIMQGEPPKAQKPADRTGTMSFLDHLEELRWRIIKGLIGVLVGVAIAFVFSDFFVEKVMLGPTRADFFMYDILRVDAVNFELQSRRLPGQFFTFWGTLFVMGFVIGSPIFIYQIWAFVEPALESREKRKTFFSTFFITFFFLLGVAFGYMILVPFALQFFAQFQISDIIRNDFDINEYFSSVSMWVVACGIIFQIPVVSYSLSKIGLLTPDLLRKYRRHSIVFALVISAMLTPPDPISQILIALPLTVLYELSIWISRYAMRKRKKELEEAITGVSESDSSR